MNGRRMAVLGGGPVGLHALARARAHGWDATLYERGRVGENVRGWGHVRMFSPRAMNAPPASGERPGREDQAGGLELGAEYVTACLEPLACSADLAGRVVTGTEVVAVARDRLRKGDEIASPARGRRPFRLLLRDRGGERVEAADVVLDATGTFATPNWFGPGGIPAVGERAAAETIDYRLPDVLGRQRAAFAGRHTLVVGAGHSAATAILWLGELADEASATRVTWVTRSVLPRLVPEVPGDPLPERARVSAGANDLASRGAPWLDRRAGSVVVGVRREACGLAVDVAETGAKRAIVADRLLALVGYRPELGLARELQVHTCWATEGTYPLAAALLAQTGEAAPDCLAGTGLGPTTLLHPETGFFTVGAKSYGRNPNFLIRTGFQQVEDVLGWLNGRAA